MYWYLFISIKIWKKYMWDVNYNFYSLDYSKSILFAFTDYNSFWIHLLLMFFMKCIFFFCKEK